MIRTSSTLLGLIVLVSACQSPNTMLYGADVGTLAREAQNPIAKLTKAGLSNNTTFEYGDDEDDVRNQSNIEVTLPIALDDGFNVVNTLVLPVISQPELGTEDSDFGLGNLEWTAWMTLDDETSGVFGFGPVFWFPTNTGDTLGLDDLAAGIAVTMVKRPGAWVVGCQAAGLWNVPGDADDKTSTLELKPFVNYNLEDGWYWTSTPVVTADFEARSENRWTLPLGGGIGRVFAWDAQPMNFSLQAFWNAEHPEPNGGDFSIVFDIEMLYTKRGYRSWARPNPVPN